MGPEASVEDDHRARHGHAAGPGPAPGGGRLPGAPTGRLGVRARALRGARRGHGRRRGRRACARGPDRALAPREGARGLGSHLASSSEARSPIGPRCVFLEAGSGAIRGRIYRRDAGSGGLLEAFLSKKIYTNNSAIVVVT